MTMTMQPTQVLDYLFMEVTLNYCRAQPRFMRATIPRSVQISFQVVQLHFCSDDRYNVQLIISRPGWAAATTAAKTDYKRGRGRVAGGQLFQWGDVRRLSLEL